MAEFNLESRLKEFGNTGNGFDLTMDKEDLYQLLLDFGKAITPEKPKGFPSSTFDIDDNRRRYKVIDEIQDKIRKILE
jgi:hypothetical protein